MTLVTLTIQISNKRRNSVSDLDKNVRLKLSYLLIAEVDINVY